jgi:hypothetical protein
VYEFEDKEPLVGVELRACKRCGRSGWIAFTLKFGCYYTAFAYCEECHALFFSSGEDYCRKDAIRELRRLINDRSAPNVP